MTRLRLCLLLGTQLSCFPRHHLSPNNRATVASLLALAPLSKPFCKRRRLCYAVLKDDAPPEEMP
ncbi:hypothetical protein ZIOFF_062962 [Zingiber officinale]|uniref:Uncharacterized protein n=1 Tax=Zingiber officinale TaxID=94328 RepID=A0A8J5F1V0_ZINOF|nr:hypothetical protein ZIOFF_062962 [Zingiber officinale]